MVFLDCGSRFVSKRARVHGDSDSGERRFYSGQLAAGGRQWGQQTIPHPSLSVTYNRGREGKGKNQLGDVGCGQGGVLAEMS